MTAGSELGHGGSRQQWADVPQAIRDLVATAAGGPVSRATSCPGGFSPGIAATLNLADGTRRFVKAASSRPNPDTPQMHRREIVVNSWLADSVPAPRLQWHLDDGEWVVLLFDHVAGSNPSLPWSDVDIDLVLRALADAHVALTPAPHAATPAVDRLGDAFSRWRGAAESPPHGLDEWSRRHLHTLADQESRWVDAVAADTLAHLDVRADNVVVEGDRAWLVDWPHAGRCAGWADVVGMAPSVAMQGGPDGAELLRRYPGERPDTDRLAAFLAAIAGYFTIGALDPPPPGIPAVRAFQASQGRAARAWLAELLDLR